jgi:hypothetical protein
MYNSYDSPASSSAPKSRATLWIIWAALIMGELMFLMVLVRIVLPGQQGKKIVPRENLAWICFAMCAISIPIGFFFRMMILGRSQREKGEITLAAYSAGNIIFWAACEGVGYFSLVVAMMSGTLWPTEVALGIAMGMQVLTCPWRRVVVEVPAAG